MKILYKNRSFGGGAPKSLLEYAKTAKDNKVKVVVVGEYTHDPIDYKANDIELINLSYFRIRKPIKNFFILLKYLKIIQNEKPNIIHATTSLNCCFHTVVESLTNIPIIYNLPGGIVTKNTAHILKNKNLVVYSVENKLELIKYGHRESKIRVISNRIDTVESNNEYINHYRINKKKIRFLLTSRMTDAHYNSIKFIIDQVYKLNQDNIKVCLDVLGDGQYFNEFSRIAKKINQEFDSEVIQL